MGTKKGSFGEITKLIATWTDEMVAVQQELTAIQALGPESGGKGEWARALYLRNLLEGWGLNDIQEYNAADPRVPEGTRPNLVVRLAGKAARPTIWVMAHMDVVPAGDLKKWSTDPWKATVKEGKIFGRGVEDNQQGLVSALFALRALKDSGVTPPRDVALILVADEETGSRFGIDHVLEAAPDLFQPDDLVVVPDAGNPDGSMLEVAEKSILWLELTVQGKQVHASTPDQGVNAARAAAHLTVRLDQALNGTFSGRDEVFDPPRSTFEPTRHDANVPNINTIPGDEKLFFDCRVLPDVPLREVHAVVERVLREVEREFQVKIQVQSAQSAEAAPATSVDAPVVKALARAVEEVRGVQAKPMGIGGGTVAALFRRKGIPAVVWSTMDDLAHQPDEYCVIANMVEDAKVFAHLFLGKA
ncbi:MAG TPA: M20 family metallo-hydrolase [Myxococcota bacterium]|nr:M20 family metallo-hydrolase [Myxococcota bacterium]HRY94087.1 M20 family metallo-hydrolase [Myxococcota bacterium]